MAVASVSSSSSMTNRLDKPEWVCTFLEKCFTDHKDFLQQRVQPIVNRCHFQTSSSAATAAVTASASSRTFQHYYEFTTEFLEALLGFYHAKLVRPSTQAALLSTPSLLRHTLDELMSFEAKLEALYGYPVQSSRRLSLMDAFLRNGPHTFEALLKAERNHVNHALDNLRNINQPWALVHHQHHQHRAGAQQQQMLQDGGNGGGDSSSDEEDAANMIADGLSAADVAQLDDGDGGDGGGGGVSLLHLASSSATNSSHAFLSLISSLTRRYRSFKFLHHRLAMLKELQFKLFEIYEEDLIREFQSNWKKLAANARAGGLKYLVLPKKGRAATTASAGSSTVGHNNSSHSRRKRLDKLNPFEYWSTHCGLLNSIYYVTTILAEWNDEFIFLELYYFYTHRNNIQHSMAMDTDTATAHRAAASSSAMKAGDEAAATSQQQEEDVHITSEELALWMANGGHPPSSSLADMADDQPSVSTVSDRSSSAPVHAHAPSAAPSSTASASSSYLPPNFQRTLDELQVLSNLSSSINSSGASGAAAFDSSPFFANATRGGSGSGSGALTSLTPTSDSLFPKLPASELGASSAASSSSRTRSGRLAAAAAASSSGPPVLPLELSITGTLFEPILASYSSLREEMLHSLVNVVVAHFREGLRDSGYTSQGHMESSPFGSASRGLARHPDLDHFLDRCAAVAEEGVASPAARADWSLLEHHVDISKALGQTLLDLNMQLIVVHHSLTRSDNRCSAMRGESRRKEQA